jgi:hypothetical protein
VPEEQTDAPVRQDAGRPEDPDATGDGYEPLAGRVVGLKYLQRLERTPLLRRRVGRIAFLVLVIGLPVTLAILFLNAQPDDPTEMVLRQPEPPGNVAGLRVAATLKQLDTTQGDLLIQLNFLPNLALSGSNGLSDSVEIQVNDSQGNGVITFLKGATMQPRPITVSITGSRVQQYPFDSYRALLNVTAVFSESRTAIPVAMEVAGALADFEATASDQREEGSAAARIVTYIDRENGVVLWAVLFMALCWALAVSVASLAYLVLVRTDAVPSWLWPFIIGTLFALPNLRDSLPGDPPYGSAVDWGAFYWAVLIVAFALISLVIAEGVGMTRRQREAGH